MWFSVKDKLPQASGKFLVLTIDPFFGDMIDTNHWIATYDHPDDYESPSDAKGWVCADDGMPLHRVTHWMVLPENPKDLDALVARKLRADETFSEITGIV